MPVQVFDSPQAAQAFIVPQLAAIERKVYKVRYPRIRYPGLIPVDTSANQWASTVMYTSTDAVGAAQWANSLAGDVPNVDLKREPHFSAVHRAEIGYELNEEEIAQAKQLGIPLSADKANAARQAAEMFIDRAACEGAPEVGYTGFFNSPVVPVVAAPAQGGTSHWMEMTPPQLLAVVNGLLTGIYTGSLETEMADTLALPVAVYSYLATTPFNAYSERTLLQYLREANIFTVETGIPLTIKGVRGLDVAGAGGVGRAIAYERSEDVLKMHMPMPFMFGQLFHKSAWTWQVPGRFRIGGVDVRRPGAMRYMDGIS